MTYSIDSLVRSLAVVVVGLPITLAATNLTNTTARVAEATLERGTLETVTEELRKELVRPCIDYYLSKKDSKMEREAKTAIDNVMGGEVAYKALCDYITA